MTRQVATGTTIAAGVAVVASGLIALGLIRTAYDAQAHAILRREAGLVAASLDNAGAG